MQQNKKNLPPLQLEKFLLLFSPHMTTGFVVITQFEQIQIINETQHKTLYQKMSQYKKQETNYYLEIYEKMIMKKTNFSHNKYYDKNLMEKEKTQTNDMTVCLLYDREETQELEQILINIYESNTASQIVILVNGYQSLNEDLEFLRRDYNQFAEQYKCLNHYSYQSCYFTITKQKGFEVCWFILHEPQNQLRLIQWIYQGIFKFFDSQFCLITDLQMFVNRDCLPQLINILKDNPGHFGVQLSVQLNCQTKSSLPQMLGLYYNYLQQSAVQQIHSPLFCFYNWYLLQRHIDDYLTELPKQNDSITIKMNNTLPILMQSKNLHLYQCMQFKGQMTKSWDLAQSFKEISDLQQQLATCNKNALSSLNVNSIYSVIKYFFYFLKLFQSKTSLAFHVFILIIAPYQIFYQNTNSKVLQVLVAVIIPYLIIILLIIFIFLPQQFQITSLKKTKEKIKLYFSRQFDRPIVEPGVKGLKVNANQNLIFLESEDKDLLIFRKPRENEDTLYWEKIQIDKVDFDISTSNIQLQVQKKITFIYENLFTAFSIMTTCSVVVLFIDILVTYMLNLTNPVKLATFILIFFLLIIYFARYFLLIGVKDCKKACFIFLSMLSYNMIVVQFTQIYHFLYYQQNPVLYREKVSQLGEYLTMTLAIILTLIIIESQTNYNGFMLLGIFAFYTFVNLMEFFKYCIPVSKNKPQRKNQVGDQNSESFQNLIQ